LDRRADVYSAAIVLWEMLAGKKLFDTESKAGLLQQALSPTFLPPSHLVDGLPASLDAVVLRGLRKEPSDRFQTAMEMAVVLSRDCEVASVHEVAEWVQETARDLFVERDRCLVEMEAHPLPSAQPAGPLEIDSEDVVIDTGDDRPTLVRPARWMSSEATVVHKVKALRRNAGLQPLSNALPVKASTRQGVLGALLRASFGVTMRRMALFVATGVLAVLLVMSRGEMTSQGSTGGQPESIVSVRLPPAPQAIPTLVERDRAFEDAQSGNGSAGSPLVPAVASAREGAGAPPIASAPKSRVKARPMNRAAKNRGEPDDGF
jgi:serine/threonine-protein kinase